MQLDLSNPHHRRAVRVAFDRHAAITLPEPMVITLDRSDYTDITAQLAAAKAQGKLGDAQ